MTQFLIREQDLIKVKKQPPIEPKARCPFVFNWDMDCVYVDNLCNCTSDYRNGVDYGGITINPGNGDAFCNKLMDFYLLTKDLYNDKF